MRGRPRGSISSPIVLQLLLLLREAPSPNFVLSYRLGLDSKTIAKYLNYLKKKGLVIHDNGFWQLTREGFSLLSKLELSILKTKLGNQRRLILDQIYSQKNQENSKEIQFYSKEIIAAEQLDNYFSRSKNTFDERLSSIIISIEDRIGRELTEIEYAIISFLAEKTSRLKRKYLWPPEPGLSLIDWLAEETGYSTLDISRTLRELEASGIVYITSDKRRGVVKIRLDRSLG